MFRAIETGDWHFDGGFERFFGERATAVQIAHVEQMFKVAVEENIPYIFINGDISDRAILSEDTFIALVRLFLKYDNEVTVYYLVGNHDVKTVKKTALDVLEVFAQGGALKNFHIIRKPEVIELDGIDVGFIPYPYQSLDLDRNDAPVLIHAHCERAGSINDYGTILKKPKREMTIKVRAKDYVVSGHLHTYQADGNYLYPGAPYQKTFGESKKKGFCVVEAEYIDGYLEVNHEFRLLKSSFVLEKLQISSVRDLDKIEKPNDRNFYSLFVQDGVVLPKSWLVEHPNVISTNGAHKFKRQPIDNVEQRSTPKVTLTSGLEDYLYKLELSEDQIDIAFEMVEEALYKLGLSN